MPYIITMNLGRETLDRRAVATLAEVVATLNATGADWKLDGANGESGTVGPLPNGAVIQVAAVDWADLPPVAEARKRYPHGSGRDAVLRDYNAQA